MPAAGPSMVPMTITLNKYSALKAFRHLRREPGNAALILQAASLEPSDPYPHARWTRRRLSFPELGLEGPSSEKNPIFIATPDPRRRPQSRGARCTVYARPMPRGSFVDLGGGVMASSPELLFVEMARMLTLPDLVILGCELCGCYALDPMRPKEGSALFGIPSLTTVESIRSYAQRARWLPGAPRALRALRYVADNAWSPMEAMVATIASLPIHEHGFGMRGVTLNRRVTTSRRSARESVRRSRVPDLLFSDTRVGINYDGSGHLDLDGIVRAARAAERGDDDLADLRLASKMGDVRDTYVDDRRRDRELGAQGYLVLVMTKEDLYAFRGLDALMAQVIGCIERRCGTQLAEQRAALESPSHVGARQRLVWSLLRGGGEA